jgi:hypothetical protein
METEWSKMGPGLAVERGGGDKLKNIFVEVFIQRW